MKLPPFTTIAELELRYHTLLFDAYGVLINSTEALPGARTMIEGLNHRNKPYFVVTNGSQLSTVKTAKKYQGLGLDIAPERVISSGILLRTWAQQHGLQKAKFLVLGPSSCYEVMEENGLTNIVPIDADDFDVLVVGNQDGFVFDKTMDHVISRLCAAIEQGKPIPMVLPNPDLIYPKAQGYGITAGMVAHVISGALQIRYPHTAPQFICLGKPYAPIFDEAKKRAGTNSLVLVGDQIGTDIKGAKSAGIASVLIGTGLAKFADLERAEFVPDFLLHNLLD
jgi:HAD superfamily hydrolase (TIGR01450 family)